MKRFKRMVVIADSPVYLSGNISFGFGPVVREFEYIQQDIAEIIWMGFIWPNDEGNPIYDKISNQKIKIVPLKLIGGKSFLDKILVAIVTPVWAYKILKLILSADIVHTRGPSTPAFIACVMSVFFRNKVWWNKYAGNWMQENPPFLYAVQKKLLRKLSFSKVTINGFWPDSPPHCISFENPCLYDEDIRNGMVVAQQKDFSKNFILLFIGRLQIKKGVQLILDMLNENHLPRVKEIHLVGDGPDRSSFEEKAKKINKKIIFHGFLKHEEVHDLIMKSHFLLLPSTASEGFPKVIAEASCYGCIPIVSDISSITHYVKDGKNGFVWQIKGDKKYDDVVKDVLRKSETELNTIGQAANELASHFTFSNFRTKLQKLVY